MFEVVIAFMFVCMFVLRKEIDIGGKQTKCSTRAFLTKKEFAILLRSRNT